MVLRIYHLFYFISFFFLILQLEAENFPEVSHKYEISAVPTFLLFKVGYRWASDIMFHSEKFYYCIKQAEPWTFKWTFNWLPGCVVYHKVRVIHICSHQKLTMDTMEKQTPCSCWTLVLYFTKYQVWTWNCLLQNFATTLMYLPA